MSTLRGARGSLFRLFAILCLFAWSIGVRAQTEVAKNDQSSKHSVTIADAIATTRLADRLYFRGADAKGRVALFSPDGKLFVIVLRTGDVSRNRNDFSLLLYRTDEVLRSSTADVLLRMSSSSNGDAISHVRWLSDSQTILFVGEQPGEISQVYQLNIRSRQLIRRTSSVAPITDFDCTPDGRTILFRTETPYGQFAVPGEEQVHRQGVVITDQSLQDLLAGRYGQTNWGEVFLEERGRPPTNLPIPPGYYVRGDALSVSPDGRHALIRAYLMVKALPESWAEYNYGQVEDKYMRNFFALPMRAGPTPFTRFLLLDTASQSLAPLWNAPVSWGSAPVAWARDGKSIFLTGTRLPLEGVSDDERRLRQHETYDVAMSVDTRQYRKISKEELPKREESLAPLEVTIEEDTNTPPKIFVTDPRTKRKLLLLDLNPQFSQLKLGRVETIEWTVDGIYLIGGLYLPPDYQPGREYPLVIQTHGFNPARFSMDGINEWSSGFAARLLAANGFLVLQAQGFKTPHDQEHYNDGNRFGITGGQATRNVNVRGIEAAIDSLERKGLIDKRKVGIVGFSISVSYVGYLLTHSTTHFAAASLVDGVDGGYFQELVYPQFAFDKDEKNGGVSPFGEGLKTWLKESPSFSLAKVNTPIRLLGLGRSTDVSELWEWFAALSLQKKPVDYIFLPDAAHLVVKPWERIVAQQGLVDWFRFWLKGEEDPDPAKKDQYARWRELRKLQEKNEATRTGLKR